MLLLPLLAVALAAATQQQAADTLSLTDLSLGSLSWASDTAAVRRTLGAPHSARSYDTRVDDESLHLTKWHYPGLVLTFAPNGALRLIELTGPQWRTHRGLAVGDRLQRCRLLYGTPSFSHEGNPYYFVGADPRSRLGLFTRSRNGRIIVIVLGIIVEGD